MNVLIVNTSERTGGAAVAAGRLLEALINSGEKAKMLVRDKQTDSITVAEVPGRMRARWNFLWERWCIYNHLRFSKNHLFEIDIANCGTDITSLPEFKWADVVHLNWINQGMLSLRNIRKIVKSGKPVVWTMHDMWQATGICHYSGGCMSYKTGCAGCPLLPDGGSRYKRNSTCFCHLLFIIKLLTDVRVSTFQENIPMSCQKHYSYYESGNCQYDV